MVTLLMLSLAAVSQATAQEAYQAADPADLVHAVQQLTLQLQQEPAPALLAQRQGLLKALMRRDPAAALKLILPRQTRQRLPAAWRVLVERRTAVEGTLQIFAAVAASGAETTQYELATGAGERLQLYFVHAPITRASGDHVRVRGLRLDDVMAVEALPGSPESVETLARAALAAAAPTPRKVAVILFNLQGRASRPFTRQTAKHLTFTDPISARSYFEEASFGQMTLQGRNAVDGDVFGWYTLACDEDPATAAPSCNLCDRTGWATAARAKAGVALSDYDHFVYAFPAHPACNWGGFGNIGGAPGHVWLNGGYSAALLSHELGHNLGLEHANTVDCHVSGQRVAVSETCTFNAYGDVFDVMGSGFRHPNMFNKARAGWLQPANTQEVTASGLYALAPLASATSGTQVLRVLRKGFAESAQAEYYYIEVRQPYGAYHEQYNANDPAIHGVMLRLGAGYDVSKTTNLIDATPATASFHDAPLAVNQTLAEPARNIAFTTRSISASGAMVEVQLGPLACVRSLPTLTVTAPADPWATAGGELAYTLTVTNNDNNLCTSSDFPLTPQLPTGWRQAPAGVTVRVVPGATVTTAVRITSAATAPPGFYDILQTIRHPADATLTATIAAGFNVVLPNVPPVISDVAAHGATATSVMLTWATDEPTATQVEYGPAQGALTLLPAQPALTTAHQYLLTGLLPNTPYVYRVHARDAQGLTTVSGLEAFATLPLTTPNLLENGGFEAEKIAWSGWSQNKGFLLTGAYEGELAAHMTFRAGDRIKELTHTKISVVPGGQYHVTAALKTVVEAGALTASLELGWFTAGGQLAAPAIPLGQTTGPTDWVLQSGVFQAPPNAAKLRVIIRGVASSGNIPADAFYDDIQVQALP